MGICSRGLVLLSSLACASACVTQSKDDVLPTPVVSTPYTPSGPVGLVNDVARSIKKVEIRVTVAEPNSCAVGFAYNQIRFELIQLGETRYMVKMVEPVKRRFDFIERLEDGQSYEGRLIYGPQERVLVRKTFFAGQADVELVLNLPCRSS